jgi:hypothetical protein
VSDTYHHGKRRKKEKSRRRQPRPWADRDLRTPLEDLERELTGKPKKKKRRKR